LFRWVPTRLQIEHIGFLSNRQSIAFTMRTDRRRDSEYGM
jgi:hypothetical protein